MDDISTNLINKIKQLKLVILDVDGVLTDGRLFFDDQGNEYKCFHARDGHGIKLLRASGVEIAVISGRKSNSVTIRMQSLGIQHVYQGYENKRIALNKIIESFPFELHEIAHVGDDLLDIPIMNQVGVAIAVQDANFAVKKFAHWCTKTPGGQGAVREICDMILQIQGNYDALLQDYL